ncbi:hypothetical protein BJ165DRAFT_1534323 [Panaeolus papilionaceus]|nr:hypothetical protein BJ165DRAFT_1534323 [Panaeolus papilionaceus]
MTDRHKRKAAELDSSIEIIPPPSTQPPASKKARRGTVTSIPSSLRPVFHSRHSSSTKSNTISKSRNMQSPTKAKANTTVHAGSSTAATTKAEGKARAKPTATTDSDDNTDSDSDSNHSSDADSDGNSDKKALTKPSTSATADPAFQFKGFLMLQIRSDKGAARKETNSQGGKGPSARTAAVSIPASSRNKKNPTDIIPRPRTVDSFRARVVMILPYGVRPAPLENRNKYNSPFNIRKNPFWSKEMGFLGSKGFAVRSPDPEGFVFNVNWSEERFFEEICSILPKAAERLIENHNEEKNGPRVWLPCVKAAYSGKIFVHPADGPYSTASMKDISGLARNTRRCDDNDGVFIVSTTKISLGDDDVDSDQDNQDSDVPMANTSAGSSSSKSRRSAKSVSVSASSRPTRAVTAKSKNVDIIQVTDDESDTASTGSPSGDTEPAASRTGTPAIDLHQSFSEFTLGSSRRPSGPSCRPSGPSRRPSGPSASSHFGCKPDIPACSVYCPSSP